MNTSAEVVIRCFDGEYKFALKARQIDELQRKCDAGIGTIISRVAVAQFYIRDILETIRLGLIGGGTPDVRALQLIELYVDGKAFMKPTRELIEGEKDNPSSPYKIADAILKACMFGMPELLEKVVVEEGTGSKKKTDGLTTADTSANGQS